MENRAENQKQERIYNNGLRAASGMMDTSATEISDEKGGNKMKKEKDPSGLKFKDYFGTTILSVTDAVGACVMTSLFMM